MNERIKELALEALQPINSVASEGVADYYTFEQTWFQLYNQKFAELIVQDCIAQVALLGISNFENDDVSWTVDMAIKNIQHRFGFEK